MGKEVHEENSSSQNGNFHVISISKKETAWGICEVNCSGGYFFVPSDIIDELGIREGDVLDEDMHVILRLHHDVYTGYKKALDLLSRRNHSAEMMRQKLRIRQFPNEVIDIIVSRLVENRYIDDEFYAEGYLEYLLAKNNLGKTMLVHKLKSKGVSREIAEELVAKVSDEYDEHALRTIGEKLLRKNKMTQEKMVRSLINKGFLPARVYEYVKINGSFLEKKS